VSNGYLHPKIRVKRLKKIIDSFLNDGDDDDDDDNNNKNNDDADDGVFEAVKKTAG